MDSTTWDARYAAAQLVWSATPNAVIEQETSPLPAGRALDLASGEGRNAIWLAEHGWRVTAVDFSDVATDRARRLGAERLGDHADRLQAVAADVLTWIPEQGAFDLVIVVYFHVGASDRRALLHRAAHALAPGGTLLVLGHHLDNIEHGVGGPQDPALLFTPEDVVADLDGTGLVVERAESLRRPVTGAGDALDAFVRGHHRAS